MKKMIFLTAVMVMSLMFVGCSNDDDVFDEVDIISQIEHSDKPEDIIRDKILPRESRFTGTLLSHGQIEWDGEYEVYLDSIIISTPLNEWNLEQIAKTTPRFIGDVSENQLYTYSRDIDVRIVYNIRYHDRHTWEISDFWCHDKLWFCKELITIDKQVNYKPTEWYVSGYVNDVIHPGAYGYSVLIDINNDNGIRVAFYNNKGKLTSEITIYEE